MLPYNNRGLLFPGIHPMKWNDFVKGYSFSGRRIHLFKGMRKALLNFKNAGCKYVYIDGSFVTIKEEPGDYDACWDTSGVDYSKLDPVFNDFSIGTQPQKLKYYGEFYPANFFEGISGITFLDFFQTDKATGNRKGIIRIDLGGVQ